MSSASPEVVYPKLTTFENSGLHWEKCVIVLISCVTSINPDYLCWMTTITTTAPTKNFQVIFRVFPSFIAYNPSRRSYFRVRFYEMSLFSLLLSSLLFANIKSMHHNFVIQNFCRPLKEAQQKKMTKVRKHSFIYKKSGKQNILLWIVSYLYRLNFAQEKKWIK